MENLTTQAENNLPTDLTAFNPVEDMTVAEYKAKIEPFSFPKERKAVNLG